MQTKNNPAKRSLESNHSNPGNMSGKTIDSGKDEYERGANADRIRDRKERVRSHDGS
jgi:hypothetical protein